PFAHAESLPGAPQERGGSAPTERRQHRLARARHCVLFDQRRQSIHKLLNEILNVGPFSHLVFSPLVARRRLAAKNRRCKAKRLILRRSVSKQWPVARLVTFIAVAFALLAGIHYYLWARLVRDPRWPASWTTVGGTLLALLALSVPLSLILGRAGQAGVRQTVVWTGYIWLGLMFLLLTTVFFSDLLRLLGAFGRRLLATRPFDPQRRLLVARSSALVPDLIAITGDLVDGSVAHLAPAIAPLAGLRAPHGVFFVTGNHEYFSGAQAWMNELRRLGIRVLRNERISIGNGTAGFDLAGVDDRSSERYGGLAPLDALRRALGDRDP